MHFESAEAQLAQKMETWNKIAAEVDLIADKLGKKVDEGIKETVVAFRASGLSTGASCEGHLSPQRKFKGPWVDIGQAAAEIVERARQMAAEKPIEMNSPEIGRLRKELSESMLRERALLLTLLDEFYSDRNVPLEQRLIVIFHSISARVMSQGVELQDLYPEDVQKKRLESFRREIDAFAAFLKNRYLSDPN
jgi:hypothetical protein